MINYTKKSTYCDLLGRAQGFLVSWADKRSPLSSQCHLSIKAWSKEMAWVRKIVLQTYYCSLLQTHMTLITVATFIVYSAYQRNCCDDNNIYCIVTAIKQCSRKSSAVLDKLMLTSYSNWRRATQVRFSNLISDCKDVFSSGCRWSLECASTWWSV